MAGGDLRDERRHLFPTDLNVDSSSSASPRFNKTLFRLRFASQLIVGVRLCADGQRTASGRSAFGRIELGVGSSQDIARSFTGDSDLLIGCQSNYSHLMFKGIVISCFFYPAII